MLFFTEEGLFFPCGNVDNDETIARGSFRMEVPDMAALQNLDVFHADLLLGRG